jgi:hypothetical protein
MRAFLKTCNERATDLRTKVIDFFKDYNEAVLVLVLAIGWLPFSWLLVWYDASSAPLDTAVLQKTYLGVANYAALLFVMAMGKKINAPILFRYWQGLDDRYPNFSKDFNALDSGWKKIIVYLFHSFLHCLLAGFCLLAANSGI